MKQSSPSTDFPVQFGLMAGLALVLSGMFHAAILAGIAWFVLRRIRPIAPSSIVLVASLLFSTAFCGLVAVGFGVLPPIMAVEMVAVIVLAVLLFRNPAPLWVYVAIAHSVLIIFRLAWTLPWATATDYQWRSAIGSFGIRALIIWLLIAHMHHPSENIRE